jgi:hypothetical protein
MNRKRQSFSHCPSHHLHFAVPAMAFSLLFTQLPVAAESPSGSELTSDIRHTTLPVQQITGSLVKEIMCSKPAVKADNTTPLLSLDGIESGGYIDSAVNENAQSPKTDIAAHEEIKDEATSPLADIHDKIDRHKVKGNNGNPLNGEISFGLPAGSVLGTVEKDEVNAARGPVVIDNDEAVETQETIKYREMPTDDGRTRILIGAKFPVVVCSQVTSKTAKRGDPFEARLKYDLKIGDRLIARKGALVRGHINYALRARCAMHSLISPERWYRNSGCIGVSFDELISENGEHIPMVATPAQCARVVKNKYEGRVLGVNHLGQVTGPWSQQLRYKAIRIGLNAAMAPAGVFSFGAMPVALGVIGAVNPSFAFMKPVGQNVRHRRIKGFAWGFLSGVPGSFLIEDTVVKGQEAVIMPGDEFLAEFKQEFTGEPETDASLMPGASTKVHGQVLPASKDKK